MLSLKISVANVRTMLAHAKKAGVDIDTVLAGTGLTENTLDTATGASELWLAYDGLGRALRMALAEAKGLRPFDETDRKIYIHYLIGADNLQGVLERHIQFMGSHRERMGFDYQLVTHFPTALILRGYHDVSLVDETGILSYLRSINQLLYLLSWLSNTRMMPMRIGLPGSYFDDFAHQITALDCPISYNTDHFEVWFSAQALERPVVRDLADAKTFLSCVSGVLRGLAAQLSLADMASEMIERHCQSTGQILTLHQLAVVLNTSETTLRRHLHKEGEGDGFSAIRQRCQLRLAKRFLVNADMTVDDIAQRIGFQDSNAFRRSFKRWTGLTPSEFRAGQMPMPASTN